MGGLPTDAKDAVTEDRGRLKKSGDDRKREPKGVRLAKGINTAVSVQCNAEWGEPERSKMMRPSSGSKGSCGSRLR